MFLSNKSKCSNLLIIFFISGILISCTKNICAQEPSPTSSPIEKSEEEKRLEERKRILLLQKDIAIAEKDIAEAQKNELASKYPSSSTTPLAGETKINDGAVIESQMIAYTALGKSANRIVKGINAMKDKAGTKVTVKNLAIFNERDVNLFLSYKVANNQIEIIRLGYCNLINTPQAVAQCPTNNAAPLVPMTIAKSFLGAFVDLTSLLRTNVEIKGTTFDLDEGPLVAEVFRAGRRSDGLGTSAEPINLYYPAMFPPDINPNARSVILTKLDVVNILRIEAGRLIGGIEKKISDVEESKGKIKTLKNSIKQTDLQNTEAAAKKARLWQVYCSSTSRRQTSNRNQDLPCRQMPAEARERFFQIQDEIEKAEISLVKLNKELASEESKLTILEKELQEMWANLNTEQNKLVTEDALAQIKSRNAQFDKFVESLISVNGAGVNPLTNYIKAENLKNALPSGSHWLQLKVLKAGGNNRIKTNLVWDIFTGGNRLSHSGGVIVQYILFDDTGKSVASDAITEYTKYMKSSKIKTLPDIAVDEVAP